MNRNIKKVQNYFDENSALWNNLYSKPTKVNHNIMIERSEIAFSFLKKYLNKNPGMVLEIGCGAGLFGLKILKENHKYYGLDISSSMIESCHSIFKKADIKKDAYDLINGNILDIDLTNKYDCIVALGVIEYQRDHHLLINSFNDLLNPGGILICSGPQKIRIFNMFGIGHLISSLYSNKKFSVYNRYSLRKFKKLLSKTKINIIDYKRIGYTNSIIHQLFGYSIALKFHKFFKWISLYLPIDWAAHHIIIVGKMNNNINK